MSVISCGLYVFGINSIRNIRNLMRIYCFGINICNCIYFPEDGRLKILLSKALWWCLVLVRPSRWIWKNFQIRVSVRKKHTGNSER